MALEYHVINALVEDKPGVLQKLLAYLQEEVLTLIVLQLENLKLKDWPV